MTAIIGLVGRAGSGKDTVFSFIRDYVHDKRVAGVAFADPLKDAILAMFAPYGVTHNHLWGSSELRGKQIGNMTNKWGFPITVRRALQTLAHEWGRRKLYRNVWVDLGIQHALQALADGDSLAVITDVRYVNEMKAIRKAGGHLWHVERPGQKLLTGTAARHASERALVKPQWWEVWRQPWHLGMLRTEYIVNDGDLTDLRIKTEGALVTHGFSYLRQRYY